ncbi:MULTISPECIES: sensor histidine kinase [unclassified Streptomyces]|uniref:sensor histidine kinase n=1 Tax=unclassified Streptomyces TaxID=2593676 RepID=UPI002E27E603|nr:histidine kinase [Streptomyces sp. NBC_00223]
MVSWLIRAGVFALVGVQVLTVAPGGPVALPVTVAGYALSGLLMALWAVLDLRRGAGPYSRWLPYALGGVMVASGAVAMLPDTGSMIALTLMAAMYAGNRTPLPAAWALFGAALPVMVVSAVLGGVDRATAFGFPLLLAVIMLAGRNRRSYRAQAEQAAAMLAQVEQLREQQRQVAVLDERTRIAREIHDVLAHSLGALGIQIQAARALLTDGGEGPDVERAVGVLSVAQRIASDGLTETRRAVHALRTDTPPLDEELARMTATHEQRHGSPVTLTVEGAAVPLPPEQTLALVRTAQESLTNSAKHAPHRPVTLTLRYADDGVTLTVSNPPGTAGAGAGGFATVDGGYGLTGMRERLLLLGGTLAAGVRDGRWVVTARVPK